MDLSDCSIFKSKSCDSLDIDDVRGVRFISCEGEFTDRFVFIVVFEFILFLVDYEFFLESS